MGSPSSFILDKGWDGQVAKTPSDAWQPTDRSGNTSRYSRYQARRKEDGRDGEGEGFKPCLCQSVLFACLCREIFSSDAEYATGGYS